MTLQKNQAFLIGLVCVLIVLMTFVAGFVLMHDEQPISASPSAGGEGPVVPASAGALPVAAVVMSAPVELVDWTTLQSGCNVEQTGTSIHIWGTNDTDGWGHENGVEGKVEYPVQDFDVSADFMVPRSKGSGWALAFLRVRESNYSQVTLQFLTRGNSYVLQTWSKDRPEGKQTEFCRTELRKFGDEAKAYHRMRLKYDAATHEATGYVDDKMVGTIDYEFQSNVRFVLGLATDKKGNDVDLYFDRVTLSLGGNKSDPGLTGQTP